MHVGKVDKNGMEGGVTEQKYVNYSCQSVYLIPPLFLTCDFVNEHLFAIGFK